MTRSPLRCFFLLVMAGGLLAVRTAEGVSPSACRQQATDACYFDFRPRPGPERMHYFASRSPAAASTQDGPLAALIVIHGHPRDANTTFNAALAAAESANAANKTLIIAPVFQVPANEAGQCSTPGVPAADAGDLLWTCTSWLDGGEASNASGMTSFAATDALIDEVIRRWPTVRMVTIAGFSAGAQMVQHYIGFAAAARSTKMAVRYVVADPGTWLYFDDKRAAAEMDGQTADGLGCVAESCRFHLISPAAGCHNANQWKYGTDDLPAALKRPAGAARMQYAAADIHYLEAARDSGTGKGTYSRILDKSCAAEAQGTFRLQRGLAYAAYDRQLLAPGMHRTVTVIPGCAHDVTCVFTSPDARAALFGRRH